VEISNRGATDGNLASGGLFHGEVKLKNQVKLERNHA
jgi:hypothetical protein